MQESPSNSFQRTGSGLAMSNGSATGSSAGSSSASFLYPFLDSAGPAAEGGRSDTTIDHPQDLLPDVIAAATGSWAIGTALDAETLRLNRERLGVAAKLIAELAKSGGKVLAVGNGGSACEADRLVRLLGRTVSARSIVDPVVVSALANDVGARHMFDRQIATFAKSIDVVVVFSTSGTSPNVLEAVAAARRNGASTIAFAGYGGALLGSSRDVDVCLAVPSESVHRIQEAQAAMANELVRLVDIQVAEAAAVSPS
jgi:D-sedoheptulose 7-phosphate isomerase